MCIFDTLVTKYEKEKQYLNTKLIFKTVKSNRYEIKKIMSLCSLICWLEIGRATGEKS